MRIATLAAIALTVAAAPLAAQEPFAAAPSCLSDWSCGPNRPPLGLYVRAVDAGGRWVTLEDGSVWEVEISDRATTASWQPEDFVGLRFIAAPRGDYEHLLTRVGDLDQRAAARLAGRRAPAYRAGDTPPGAAEE
ncbi:MAG TPA: hypothetical protein VFT84_14950 [Gemmatimonadales bacterium]|nr:hypothetical protein [Gemmatimonadales bacterium]